MPRQRGMGRKVLAQFGLAAVAVFISVLACAGPIELPDSARPGAVRPEQEERSDIPQGPPAETLEIPAVIDRPFDIDECPCTLVNQFRLLNAEDMPEFEISLAEAQAILDEKIKQQAEEGFSIGQLQEAANAVRDYYRKKGLILTQVVVPVQTVQSGTVDLEVFVGKLGRVLAEGNKIYSPEILEQAFKDQIGQPINKADIEAALLRLTDYAGLTVFGVFQPGLLVGTADIVLKVQEEKRFDVAMRVDDHGTVETGRNHFRTVIDWNNPTGGADKLTLSIQQSYIPKANVFKAVDYERFIGDSSYKVGAFFNTNKFEVAEGTFSGLQIHANSENVGMFLEKSFIRSRLNNLSTRFGYTKKYSETRQSDTHTNEDKLSVFTWGVDYDSVDTFSIIPKQGGGGINFATLDISQGLNDFAGAMGSAGEATQKAGGYQPSRRGGSGTFAPGMFTKLFGTYTRLQTLIKNQSLLMRAEWQWSDDLLVPLEQYSVGGADNVRAFPPAQVLWDRAYFLSFEWLFNAPFIADQVAFENRTWGELLQFSMFYDVATGRLNDPVQNVDKKTWDNLAGAGVGLRFNLPGALESNLFWAWALGSDKDKAANDKNLQVWGDFTYSF